MHFSPVPQQRPPQLGPRGQPFDGAQLDGLASTPASTHAISVHAIPVASQLHELHPSPAGKTSPRA